MFRREVYEMLVTVHEKLQENESCEDNVEA